MLMDQNPSLNSKTIIIYIINDLLIKTNNLIMFFQHS